MKLYIFKRLEEMRRKVMSRARNINWKGFDRNIYRFYQISWRLAVALLVTGMFIFVYRGLKDDNYAIQSFQVPKAFTEAGFNGTVLANKLFDEVRTIEEFVASQKEDQLNIQSEVKPDLNLDVMGFGFSVNSIIYYTKDLLGRENRFISGELTDMGNQLELTLRLTGHPAQSYSYEYEDGQRQEALDHVVHEGAKGLLNLLDPYRLAVYHYKKNDDQISLKLIQEIIKGSKKEAAWGYLAYGNLLQKQERHAEACKKYEKATQIDPKFVLAWGNWAWAKIQLNEYEAAIPIFEIASKLKPDVNGYWHGLALCHHELEHWELAEHFYEKAVQAQPNIPWSYMNWANFKFATLADTAGAIEIMDRALEQLVEEDQRYMMQSTQYFYRNQMDSCLLMVSAALELNPDNVSALTNASQYLYHVAKDYQMARKFLNKQVDILQSKFSFPKTYQLQQAYNLKAMVDYQLVEFDSALYHARLAIALDTSIAYPYSTLAETYGLMDKEELFYQNLEKALDKGFELDSETLQHPPYLQRKDQERFKRLLKRS